MTKLPSWNSQWDINKWLGGRRERGADSSCVIVLLREVGRAPVLAEGVVLAEGKTICVSVLFLFVRALCGYVVWLWVSESLGGRELAFTG